jgi:hypothetical protein
LTRGVLALAGGLGLSLGRVTGSVRAEEAVPGVQGGAVTLTLYGRDWHLAAHDRRPGQLPVTGDRMGMFGELLDGAEGEKVGEFYAACFCVDSPFGATPYAAANIEFHTFNLDGGSISGMGTASAGENVYAIVGGTGRYAGARGSYVAVQRPAELGGDGTAEFHLTVTG